MDGLNTSPQLNQLPTVCTRDNYHSRMSVRNEIDLHFLLNLDISRIPSTKEEQRSEIALHSNSTWICLQILVGEIKNEVNGLDFDFKFVFIINAGNKFAITGRDYGLHSGPSFAIHLGTCLHHQSQ